MTISFDTSASTRDARSSGGSDREIEDDPCGQNLDWFSGMEGLRQSVGAGANPGSGQLLTRIIERDIIPRLLLAHRAPAAPIGRSAVERDSARAAPDPIDFNNSEAFARLVLASEPEQIMEHVQALLDAGVGLQRIYLDLLAPVARRLGELWEDDRCTFIDVSIGLLRLQQVLHEIGRRNRPGAVTKPVRRRIYLAPAPGEQHTFGLTMVEEFFLHAGWETAIDHAADIDTILETVTHKKLEVIGFTISRDESFEPLLEVIEKIREVSLNRGVVIMVGGRYLFDHPECAARLGSAVVISDGVGAVETAETLLSTPRKSLSTHHIE